MKKVLYLLFAATVFFSCGNGTNKKTNTSAQTESNVETNVVSNPDRIEVLYFHGAQRCITCRAIEKHTKELLDSLYSTEMANGTIVYRTIDISQKENQDIADKYEVTWSSLFINKWNNGKEKPNNMTEYAFSYAKGQPDTFKTGIKDKIEELKK